MQAKKLYFGAPKGLALAIALALALAMTTATFGSAYYQPTQILNSYPIGVTVDWATKAEPVPQPQPSQPVNLSASSEPVASYQKRSEIPVPTASILTTPTPPPATDENGEPDDSAETTTTTTKDPTYSMPGSLLDERSRLVVLRDKMISSQGVANVSIEDTNWKIAAECLSARFGPRLISNKDVKCAASQVVLSISRMHRASCKFCELFFHCEGFTKALKRCNNNYDVEQTLDVLRGCKGLVSIDADIDKATRGKDCIKEYLCAKDCKFNPVENTCPRNSCYPGGMGPPANLNSFNTRLPRPDQLSDRRTRPNKAAFPEGSPIRQMLTDKKGN